jgi:basic amino acid/polyamine antiporter, APA family
MNTFHRVLNFRTTLALVIGGVIGSGIFMKPALMASQLGSPLLLLSVWVVAGIFTLFGALSNAEVAAMFPETGGQYIFFQKMYGRGFAFLYGWAAFAVFNTAGNASVAFVCSEYANYFLHLPRFSPTTEKLITLHLPFIGDFYPLQNAGVKALTILLVLYFSLLNYRSVRYGAATQRALTALKLVAIALLVTGLLGSGKGQVDHLFQNASHPLQLGAFVAALSGAFWAYDGWNNITFIAGEIEKPQRNIPRSLLVGLSCCLIVYLLVNLAFIYVLPFVSIAGSSFVASDAAAAVWGTAGAVVITGLVVLSTLGTTNGNILATARATYALGSDHRLFRWVGRVQPRYHTPGRALLANAAWSCGLILTGSFDMLTDMLVFVSWLFYGMSAVGLFVLRRKYPDHPRPYKVVGYPVVPAVFILFTALFLGVTLYNDITNYASGKSPVINSVFGLCITAIGLPLYFLSLRAEKNTRPLVAQSPSGR